MTEFAKTACGNYVLEADGFSISFRGHGTHPLGRSFDSETTDGETAIVHGGKFYILNGDHRPPYSDLHSKGLSACLAYFEMNEDQASGWSDSLEQSAGGVA